MVGRVARLRHDAAVDGPQAAAEEMVDPLRPARGAARVAGLDADRAEGVIEAARERAQGGCLDGRVEVAGHHQRPVQAGGDPRQLVGLRASLLRPGIGQVRVDDREIAPGPRDAAADRTARLAGPVRRVGEGHAGQVTTAALGFDRLVVPTQRQPDGKAVDDRHPREQGVAPRRRTDRATILGLDQGERMDRRIPDLPVGQPRELQRFVEQLAVWRQQGDFLQGDDVGVEIDDLLRDPLEPVAPDVPPPGRRERLSRADGGPDVPGGDPDGRRNGQPPGYLTDPASNPWTK